MRYEVDKAIFLECYHHLLSGDHFDIEFIWGGRDSGKSQHVAMQLAFDSLADPNFRCILIKKTAESIKDSQWQTLKDVTADYEVDHLYTFRKSPLEVEVQNGAQFIARGCDDPKKLKSIRNPSHAWIEEGDQLSADDLTLILTTLRSNEVRVKIYFVFNPELPKGVSDLEEYWLYRDWFKDKPEGSFTDAKVFESNGQPVQITYRSTWTTYKDNPYVTEVRKAFLEGLAETNPRYYLPYTLGKWGKPANDNPFFYSFQRSKHTGKAYHISTTDYVDLSFDFNHTPTTLIVGQMTARGASVIDHISTTPTTVQGMTPIEAACEVFKRRYIDTGLVQLHQIRITGDASGAQRKADRKADENFYFDILKAFGLQRRTLRTPKANPMHKESYEMINYILANLSTPTLTIGDHMTMLISEIEQAYPDERLSLDKAKKELGLHGVDAFRYLMHLWFDARKYKQQVLYLQDL
jgi:PBSX family phage terminase large subunit